MVEKSAVKVDGKRAEVRRILKDGTNYIAVRDSNIKIRYAKKTVWLCLPNLLTIIKIQ